MASPQAAPPHPPLTGARLVIGTIAVSLAVFMNVLDTSIANVSIPTISGDLGVSSDQGTWVITSFAVANAISVPLTGWLTDRIGQVRLFLASIILFVISSWMCGLSPTLPFLLLSRVIQGAVAGPMIPLSQTLLLASYPRARAPAALAMWSMTTLIAPVAGPILGGWISDNISWPWIFYVNIPVGVAAALATYAIFRERDSVIKKAPIDTVGLSLLVIWVGSLQVMLDKGKDLDWFSSTTIVALALVAAIGFAFFVIWELTAEHPVVDLSLFRKRNFTGGTVALSIGYGLYFGNLVLLPLWLQTDLGYTATDAGLVMAPVGVFAILLSPVTGKFLPRTDPRKIATARVPRVRAVLLDALALYDGRGYVVARATHARAGHRHGRLFHSARVDHAVGAAGQPDRGRVGPLKLRADHVRRDRHLDLHDGLGPQDDLSPCPVDRARQCVRSDLQPVACPNGRDDGARHVAALRPLRQARQPASRAARRQRPVLLVVVGVRRAHCADLDHPARARGRRRFERGGIRRALTPMRTAHEPCHAAAKQKPGNANAGLLSLHGQRCQLRAA